MTSEELNEYINSSLAENRRDGSRELYYYGKHSGIYYDAPKGSPDNRVPVTIPRKGVKFIAGYMAKPGNIVYSGDFYDERLSDVYNACEESILTAEEMTTALIHGRAYELHWFDGSEPRFAEVPVGQSIMIYSDDLGIFAKPRYFIRHWRDSMFSTRADVYDSSTVQHWIGDGVSWKLESEELHGYKSVPVVEFTIDRDKANLFDHVLPIVDVLDKGVSEDIADELQRFANAYLLMAERIDDSQGTDGLTDVDRSKGVKVFDNLRDAVKTKVDFLTKNINPEFINSALDRLERLTYELMSIPNPSDDTFAASSGIALAYKLVPLEYLCTNIETYFSRGLQQRIRLISSLDATINGGDGVDEVSISFHRNLPFDLSTMADVAMKLKGILSDEAILKLFPATIVPDIEKELERLSISAPEMTIDDNSQNDETAPVDASADDAEGI